MQEILKDYVYVIASEGRGGASMDGRELRGVFIRAALKHGYQATYTSMRQAEKLGGVSFYKSLSFKAVQEVLDTTAAAIGHSVYLSAKTDLLGKEIDSYPAEEIISVVKSNSILRTSR